MGIRTAAGADNSRPVRIIPAAQSSAGGPDERKAPLGNCPITRARRGRPHYHYTVGAEGKLLMRLHAPNSVPVLSQNLPQRIQRPFCTGKGHRETKFSAIGHPRYRGLEPIPVASGVREASSAPPLALAMSSPLKLRAGYCCQFGVRSANTTLRRLASEGPRASPVPEAPAYRHVNENYSAVVKT